MSDTHTRRVRDHRGNEKTVNLKRLDLEEPKRVKRAAREAARAEARQRLQPETVAPTPKPALEKPAK